jgi:hypothetical protein
MLSVLLDRQKEKKKELISSLRVNFGQIVHHCSIGGVDLVRSLKEKDSICIVFRFLVEHTKLSLNEGEKKHEGRRTCMLAM